MLAEMAASQASLECVDQRDFISDMKTHGGVQGDLQFQMQTSTTQENFADFLRSVFPFPSDHLCRMPTA